jgi:hypothetical protein
MTQFLFFVKKLIQAIPPHYPSEQTYFTYASVGRLTLFLKLTLQLKNCREGKVNHLRNLRQPYFPFIPLPHSHPSFQLYSSFSPHPFSPPVPCQFIYTSYLFLFSFPIHANFLSIFLPFYSSYPSHSSLPYRSAIPSRSFFFPVQCSISVPRSYSSSLLPIPPPHRVHRVATAAFWRTFSDEGKIGPGW